MTPEEFKQRWESNDDGGGITYNDIAECAKKWGLYSSPRASDITKVRYAVLKRAGVSDLEDWK